ncbi:MAG: hypothetical protein Q9M09_02955, partial [Mariprofundaceae bacterium]|nr:hypothetical protein [Mariprofundaceae bacterium]
PTCKPAPTMVEKFQKTSLHFFHGACPKIKEMNSKSHGYRIPHSARDRGLPNTYDSRHKKRRIALLYKSFCNAEARGIDKKKMLKYLWSATYIHARHVRVYGAQHSIITMILGILHTVVYTKNHQSGFIIDPFTHLGK